MLPLRGRLAAQGCKQEQTHREADRYWVSDFHVYFAFHIQHCAICRQTSIFGKQKAPQLSLQGF